MANQPPPTQATVSCPDRWAELPDGKQSPAEWLRQSLAYGGGIWAVYWPNGRGHVGVVSDRYELYKVRAHAAKLLINAYSMGARVEWWPGTLPGATQREAITQCKITLQGRRVALAQLARLGVP